MFIGIDAGGTKTDVCICSSKGHISFRSISGGINAARMGAAAAAEMLIAVIPDIPDIRSLYAGLAGAASPAISAAIAEKLRAHYGHIPSVTVASDAFNGFNAEVGLVDGIALIAGTGSSAFVRARGKVTQIGGRGYLVDDAGSGYWVGRACLNAAYRALDGRGPATQLVSSVEALLGSPLSESIPSIYEKGPSFVASFAPLVFDAAASGDHAAKDIAQSCAAELWLHIRACLAHMTDSPHCTCVATGGMFRSEYLRGCLDAYAKDSPVTVIYSDIPPVAGAVIAAAGSSADAEFIKNLKDDLNGLR